MTGKKKDAVEATFTDALDAAVMHFDEEFMKF